MINIEDRLIQLLEERKFKPVLHPRSGDIPNWTITFLCEDGLMNVITPLTQVDQLWWLKDEIGDEAPGTPFEAWLKDLDQLFVAEYGLTHEDFEDYDWSAEFNGENSPRDSFDEWKLMNEGATLGG